MNARVSVIINPAAGRGRGATRVAEVRAAFGAVGVGGVEISDAPGGEYVIARRAIERGSSTLVAVGGDGTWSNVANAILDARADCRLALLAAGTGNDFAKTTGAPVQDANATARLAVDGRDLRIDVGRIEGRYFLNVAGFGLDIAVLEDIKRIAWLRGGLLYLYSACRQLFRYPGLEIEIASAAGRRGARHLMLIVANARHFGGSFHIAPGASLTDGRLDAVSVLDASPLRRFRLLGAASRGTHTALPEVRTEQAASFRLTFSEPPAYETDGEYRRAASAELEVTCVPRALRLVTPAADAGP